VDLTVIKLLVDCPNVYVFTWYFFLNSSKLNTLGYDGLYICCCCVNILLLLIALVVIIEEGYTTVDGGGITIGGERC